MGFGKLCVSNLWKNSKVKKKKKLIPKMPEINNEGP